MCFDCWRWGCLSRCCAEVFVSTAAASDRVQDCFVVLRRARQGRTGGRVPLDSRILQQVEQTDLINYGLIPEFVGRFPIITALSVST